MLILTLCITLALAALFAWLPGRLCRRGLARADLLAGPGLAAAVWLWAACIYEKPGLAVDFDAFRLLHLTAMTLWACGLALGFRLRKKLPRLRTAAAVGLLAVLALGLEGFVCNLNFWATHGYTPVDLRPWLAEDADPGAPLVLDADHTTLTFAGLDQELYNLQLAGLA